MIWVTNSKGDLTYICRDWQTITGQSRDAALGKGWLNAVHPDDRSLVSRTFEKALAEEATFTTQFRVVQTDGAWCWLSAGAVPSVDPCTDDFLGYLGSAVERPDKRLQQASFVIASGDARSERETVNASRWQMILSLLASARVSSIQDDCNEVRTRIDEAVSIIVNQIRD